MKYQKYQLRSFYPFYKGGYFVFIYKNKSHTSIKNIDDVSTSKLLDSIATQDFNKYRYNLNNNQQISFYKNTNQRPVLGPDEVSTSNDIKGYELYIVLAIFIILDIILALITAYFVSKRLTKPLFFYTDWIKIYPMESCSSLKKVKSRKDQKIIHGT